jgi:uncharacterized membrane protein YqjE
MSDQTTPPRERAGTTSGAYSAGTDGHRGSPDAIAEAINDVTSHVQGLVKEEVELAKAELQAKLRKLLTGVIAGAVAGVFALGALLLILHGLAWFVYWVIPFPDGQIFWGFFVVAALLLLVGALLAYVASRAIKKGTPPAPTMAIDEAKLIRETVQSSSPETTVPARTEVRS